MIIATWDSLLQNGVHPRTGEETVIEEYNIIIQNDK